MKQLTVILYNIRSTYNVGAILRTCDCLGVNEVIFTGYTPFIDKGLPHEQSKLEKQIHKTALGAERTLKWRRAEINEAIAELKGQGYKIVALEQGSNSLNLADSPRLEGSIALILGEEVHGIPEELLKKCDQLLEIPMLGTKESFNVSVATGIALWELTKPYLSGTRAYLRKQTESPQS
ncbi:TrmH family RNA methyltransferase [Candidatus Saccharibacteria bacterium]|nr:TrmH family RNA methyltransferase [Candidatus Saccharibacteria bacterium]